MRVVAWLHVSLVGPVIDVEAHKLFAGAHRPPVCTMKQVGTKEVLERYSGAHRPPVCTMKQVGTKEVLERYSGAHRPPVCTMKRVGTREVLWWPCLVQSRAVHNSPHAWLAGWLAGCIAYGYSYTTVRHFPLIHRRDDSGQS